MSYLMVKLKKITSNDNAFINLMGYVNHAFEFDTC